MLDYIGEFNADGVYSKVQNSLSCIWVNFLRAYLLKFLESFFENILIYEDSIGLVRNFLCFFRKFPGTAENVLEYSILGLNIDSMNTVRMTTKLSKWKLISN